MYYNCDLKKCEHFKMILTLLAQHSWVASDMALGAVHREIYFQMASFDGHHHAGDGVAAHLVVSTSFSPYYRNKSEILLKTLCY